MIKTHRPPTNPKYNEKYDKAVLLIRNPFDAFQSEFNRQKSQPNHRHTGFADTEVYKHEWKSFVEIKQKFGENWYAFHKSWIEHYKESRNIHIIFYEDLVKDTESELKKLLGFLAVDFTKKELKCTIENKEGLYHRPKKQSHVNGWFNNDMRLKICSFKKRVIKSLKNHCNYCKENYCN